MDPKELYPNYDRNDSDPFQKNSGDPSVQVQEEPKDTYGYRKPGTAITSMVLGICSVSLWFYPFFTSIPCIIMGFIARRLAINEEGRIDPKYNGFLKAGKITGIIGAIVSIVYTLFWAAIIGLAFNRN